MKLLKCLLLLSLVLGNGALIADDGNNINSSGTERSEDVVISGTISSVDESRRLIVVAGRTIHMSELGIIPFKKGQSVQVVTTKIKGQIRYLGKYMPNQGRSKR